MSIRTRTFEAPTGVNTPYPDLAEYVNDKSRMDEIARALEIILDHVQKDSCGQWSIIGKAAQLQTAGKETYLIFVRSYSSRKWGAIKRQAGSLGWEVVQDGDDEGTLLLRTPTAQKAADFTRSLLGLRKRRDRSENAPLSNSVSAP